MSFFFLRISFHFIINVVEASVEDNVERERPLNANERILLNYYKQTAEDLRQRNTDLTVSLRLALEQTQKLPDFVDWQKIKVITQLFFESLVDLKYVCHSFVFVKTKWNHRSHIFCPQ
jgi:hypothetical protein